MKQYIKYICISSFVALFLSACSNDNASFKSERGTTISLVGINCLTSPNSTDIDGYVTLLSDDTIIKDGANTTIEIYHDVNGSKKVCLVNGLAHILR